MRKKPKLKPLTAIGMSASIERLAFGDFDQYEQLMAIAGETKCPMFFDNQGSHQLLAWAGREILFSSNYRKGQMYISDLDDMSTADAEDVRSQFAEVAK